jgi:acyl-CoA reductase-like NAD-dependent aldehyde dehydrogenase
VLLHRPIVRPFLQMLVARCEKMTVGDGLSETTDMGPVAGPSQYQDIRAAIREAEAEGARLVTGGDPEPGDPSPDSRAPGPEPPGYFIRPTVFTYFTPDMAISRQELYGPVLAVCEFGSVDEAIALGNRSMTGCLPPSTRATPARPWRINGIEAGLAHVNVHTGYKEPAAPFGGVKQSGAGLPENSETGLEFFVDRKAVYVRG